MNKSAGESQGLGQFFQARQKQSLLVLLLMIAGIAYVSTRSPAPYSPEGQVRDAVEKMVKAAEEKELEPFRKYLSEDVWDEEKNGKKELLDLLRGLYFTHRNISLTIYSLDVQRNSNPSLMDVQLGLLMSESTLPTDRGEFFITFRREGSDWRVWSLKWGSGMGFQGE